MIRWIKLQGQYRDELKLISREEESISARLDRLYDAVETGKIGLDDLTPNLREGLLSAVSSKTLL